MCTMFAFEHLARGCPSSPIPRAANLAFWVPLDLSSSVRRSIEAFLALAQAVAYCFLAEAPIPAEAWAER